MTAVLVVLALVITAMVVAVVMLRRRKRLRTVISDSSTADVTYDVISEETKFFK